jgi:integrase
LAGQPGYRSRLKYADADYFNLSEKEMRVAKARRERPVPTLEQIRHVLSTMPAGSEIERRNRALMAFALLTGARDGAIASLKLKHIDIAEGKLIQMLGRSILNSVRLLRHSSSSRRGYPCDRGAMGQIFF